MKPIYGVLRKHETLLLLLNILDSRKFSNCLNIFQFLSNLIKILVTMNSDNISELFYFHPKGMLPCHHIWWESSLSLKYESLHFKNMKYLQAQYFTSRNKLFTTLFTVLTSLCF